MSAEASGTLRPSHTLSALYEASGSAALCTITLSQRFGADPPVTVHSPGSIVRSSLYKVECLSTAHTIQVCDVQNAGYVDYINAIALCLMKSGLPIDVIVAEQDGHDHMLYSPSDDRICSSRIGAADPLHRLDSLRSRCLAKYEELRSRIR